MVSESKYKCQSCGLTRTMKIAGGVEPEELGIRCISENELTLHRLV